MKKQLLSFLLGGFVFVCVAAGTTDIMTVKPATPKQTVVKEFRAMFGLENDVAKYVKEKVKEGYIVKSVMIWDDETWSKGVIVMEKY